MGPAPMIAAVSAPPPAAAAAAHAVQRDGEGLDQRGLLGRHAVGQREARPGRRPHELGEAAVVHPEPDAARELQAAQVVLARLARRAGAVAIGGQHRHPLALGHVGDRVAHRDHGAAELVAHHRAGRQQPGLLQVEVAAADAAPLDGDDHVVRGRAWARACRRPRGSHRR